jgi:hypothetical protein
MKQFLIIILAICLVLFVLVPLAYMSMGRIPNPWEIAPTTNYNPAYSSSTPQSTETDILTRVFGGSYAKLDQANPCSNPSSSLEPHIRDATLSREGNASIISSASYDMSMRLDGPVTDWQYTSANGAKGMEDELASFTYGNLIVNILARSSVGPCIKVAGENFKNFHTGNASAEYFSSSIYINQGRPIGLRSATLRTFGKGEIDDTQYYWYLLDETYSGFEDRPVVTLWYSTYIRGREFWFAFRTYKAEEGGLNAKAEGILENITFQ